MSVTNSASCAYPVRHGNSATANSKITSPPAPCHRLACEAAPPARQETPRAARSVRSLFPGYRPTSRHCTGLCFLTVCGRAHSTSGVLEAEVVGEEAAASTRIAGLPVEVRRLLGFQGVLKPRQAWVRSSTLLAAGPNASSTTTTSTLHFRFAPSHTLTEAPFAGPSERDPRIRWTGSSSRSSRSGSSSALRRVDCQTGVRLTALSLGPEKGQQRWERDTSSANLQQVTRLRRARSWSDTARYTCKRVPPSSQRASACLKTKGS